MLTFKTEATVTGRARPGQLRAEEFEPDAPRSGIARNKTEDGWEDVRVTRVTLEDDGVDFEVWARQPDMSKVSWEQLLAANRGDRLVIEGKISCWNRSSYTLMPTRVRRP